MENLMEKLEKGKFPLEYSELDISDMFFTGIIKSECPVCNKVTDIDIESESYMCQCGTPVLSPCLNDDEVLNVRHIQ